MAKKNENNDLVFVVQLAEDGVCGTITVQRKDLAVIHQFNYQETEEIWEAVKLAAVKLAAVEENPPPMDMPKANTLEKIAGKPAPAEDAAGEDAAAAAEGREEMEDSDND